MKTVGLKQLVGRQLEAIGADGLVYPEFECGCRLNDLMPCGDQMDPVKCVAARFQKKVDPEEIDWLVPMEVTTGRGRCCECGEIVGVQDGETVAHQHGGVQCCGSHCRPESIVGE